MLLYPKLARAGRIAVFALTGGFVYPNALVEGVAASTFVSNSKVGKALTPPADDSPVP